ncbi:MAG: N-acetyltransferase [Anaerolineaceae bacterium]|nr:N-acetyltransferase [Anaerolineaceae bacterium]
MGILNRFRVEEPQDLDAIYKVQVAAFERETEADLVNDLRGSEDCLCSVVAESNGEIVGHCLYTKVNVVSEKGSFSAAALGPVAVIPDLQGEKLGTMLIITATNMVIQKGYPILFVLGDKEYYHRFGYSDASLFGFSLPYVTPPGAFMVAALNPKNLKGKSGVVHYVKAFDVFK